MIIRTAVVKLRMTVTVDCRMKLLEDDGQLLASGFCEANSIAFILGVGISAKTQIILNYD